MKNPELLAMSKIPWQLFCTFTFASAQLPESVRLSIFFAVMRATAKNSGLHFRNLLWCLRRERGEQFGRVHFHAVIAGLPLWFVNWTTTERTCQLWAKCGGGHAKVTVYDLTLDGIGYILKGDKPESDATRIAGDYHELTKFGSSCEVTVSESVVRTLDAQLRPSAVFKVRGQLRRGRTHTRPCTAQSGVGIPSPLLATGAATTRSASIYP